jgi:hypothetical protein
MSASITSNRALEREEVERQPQPDTSQATWNDACTQNPESRSFVSDTAQSCTSSSARENETLDRTERAGSQQSQNLQPVDAEVERGPSSYLGLHSVVIQDQESILFKDIPPPDPRFTYPSPYFCNYLRDTESPKYLNFERSDRRRVYRRPPRLISNPPVLQPPETYSTVSTLSSEKDGSSLDTILCPECDQSFTGKYGKGNLARHMRTVHQVAKTYPCMVSGCERTYARKDALLKHKRKKHHPFLDPINPIREALHVTNQREVILEIEDRMEVIC